MLLEVKRLKRIPQAVLRDRKGSSPRGPGPRSDGSRRCDRHRLGAGCHAIPWRPALWRASVRSVYVRCRSILARSSGSSRLLHSSAPRHAGRPNRGASVRVSGSKEMAGTACKEHLRSARRRGVLLGQRAAAARTDLDRTGRIGGGTLCG